MRSNRINYIVVGSFVLLVLAGLIVSVAILTGRTGATDTYYTVYDNVGGISPGTQVLYEGYPVGQVDEIEPERRDGRVRFRVAMAVRQGWAIPQGSQTVVAASGLLSGVSIEIRGGEGEEALPPGSEIPAGPSADLFAAVNTVAAEVTELSEEGLKPLVAKLNRYVDALGQQLTQDTPAVVGNLKSASGDLSETLPRILANLEAFSDSLNAEVLGEANRARLESSLGNLEAATATLNEDLLGPGNRERLSSILESMDRFSGNFAELSSDLRTTKAKVESIVEELDTMLADNREHVNQGLEDLRYTAQSVARHIDAITYNLEGTSRNMHEFSRQIRQNPGLLLGGTPPKDEAR